MQQCHRNTRSVEANNDLQSLEQEELNPKQVAVMEQCHINTTLHNVEATIELRGLEQEELNPKQVQKQRQQCSNAT